MNSTPLSARNNERSNASGAVRANPPQAKKPDSKDTIVDIVGKKDVLAGAHAKARSADNASHGHIHPDPSVFAFSSQREQMEGFQEQCEFLEAASRFAQENGEDLTQLRAKMRSLAARLNDLQHVPTDDPATARLAKAVNDAIDEYEDMLQQVKASCKDYWPGEFGANFFSGTLAFLLCFGPGTLTGSALEMPVASWAISTVVWAITERFIPMARKTSWKSYAADVTYPTLAKMIQRAARDSVRSCKGLPAKRYRHQTEDGIEFLTAVETLKRIDAGRTWWDKFKTDDLPYYFYSLYYGLRYTAIAWYGFPPTAAASLSSLLLAGAMAGACTAVTMQYARRQQYQPPKGKDKFSGQVLVQSRAMWRKKMEIIQKRIDLLEAQAGGLASGKTNKLADITLEKNRLLKELANAHTRAHFLFSIGFEMASLFRPKRNPDERRGEVAGKRSEFLAGTAAKATVLGMSTTFGYGATSQVMKIPGVTAKIGGTWMQSFVLIAAFSLRKEAELAYRGLYGLAQGLYDITPGMRSVYRRCCCRTDQDEPDDRAPDANQPNILRSTSSTLDLLMQAEAERPAKFNKVDKRLALITGDDDDNHIREASSGRLDGQSGNDSSQSSSEHGRLQGKAGRNASPQNDARINQSHGATENKAEKGRGPMGRKANEKGAHRKEAIRLDISSSDSSSGSNSNSG